MSPGHGRPRFGPPKRGNESARKTQSGMGDQPQPVRERVAAAGVVTHVRAQCASARGASGVPQCLATERSVSVLTSFEADGLGPQVRRRCPAGSCPRPRLRLWPVMRIFVRPPLPISSGRVGKRETEQGFNLSEREDHRVRVAFLQGTWYSPLYVSAMVVPPIE